MKVVNVDFVENEMMELYLVQIGQIEVDGGDESDCDDVECGDKCGDDHAKGTKLAAIPFPPLHPPLHPPNNQSKPIVQLILLSHYNFSL